MCSALVIKREALSLKTGLKKSRLFSQICWHNSISNTLTAFLSAPRWRMVLLSWHRVNLMFFSWRRFSTYKTQQERTIRNLKHLSSSAKKIKQKKCYIGLFQVPHQCHLLLLPPTNPSTHLLLPYLVPGKML